jgi:hypothetical protein
MIPEPVEKTVNSETEAQFVALLSILTLLHLPSLVLPPGHVVL